MRQHVNSYHCNKCKAPDKQECKSTNLSSSMCAKPHTKIYINNHHHKNHLKMWLTSGSHSCDSQTSSVFTPITSSWLCMLTSLSTYMVSILVLKLQTQINTNTQHNPMHIQITPIHITFHTGTYNILISWENCLTKNILREFPSTHWFRRCSIHKNYYVINIKSDVIRTYFNLQ